MSIFFENDPALVLHSRNADGQGVPEYRFRCPCVPGPVKWVYEADWTMRPEDRVAWHLRDQGYKVITEEGGMIRAALHGLCLAADAEQIGISLIKEKRGYITTTAGLHCSMFPTASFTQTYIRDFFQRDTVDLARWLCAAGSLALFSNSLHQPPDEYEIEAFLQAMTPPRVLAMFEQALGLGGAMSGWPDLTAMRDDQVVFVEVKTTDGLTSVQKQWLLNYSEFAGADYCIVRLVPS